MKLKKLHDQVIYISFPSQRELTETFLRFQEHYESPEFRGKVFTLGQFRKWYSESRGTFSYYADWNGMNIPSYVFDAFKQGLFDPLTAKEQALLDLFKDRGDKFYVIAGVEGNLSTKGHEIAHALYYIDPSYKTQVDGVLKRLPVATMTAIRKKLLALGYCREVLDDEAQAYLSEGREDFLERPGVDVPQEFCNEIAHARAKRIPNE